MRHICRSWFAPENLPFSELTFDHRSWSEWFTVYTSVQWTSSGELRVNSWFATWFVRLSDYVNSSIGVSALVGRFPLNEQARAFSVYRKIASPVISSRGSCNVISFDCRSNYAIELTWTPSDFIQILTLLTCSTRPAKTSTKEEGIYWLSLMHA